MKGKLGQRVTTARKGSSPRTPLAGSVGMEPGSAVRIDFSVDVGTEILVINKAGKITDTVPGPKGAYFNGIAYAGHGFYAVGASHLCGGRSASALREKCRFCSCASAPGICCPNRSREKLGF
jgi:hypothetical protein